MQWLAENKNSLSNVLKDKHICGVYGTDYEKSTQTAALLAAMGKEKQIFTAALHEPLCYMPNNGEYSKRISNCAAQLDMQVILWSKDSRAYAASDEEDFALQLANKADNGDFILVRLDRRFCKALPLIQQQLIKRKISILPLVDLLNK